MHSIDGSTYICHTCHGALKLGRIPAQSKANRMTLDEIPDELKDLHFGATHYMQKDSFHEIGEITKRETEGYQRSCSQCSS